MNVLESLLILTATLSALWWAFARHSAPLALERLSLAGLGLGVLAVALEGVHWQLVPWQLLALACAVVALLRASTAGALPRGRPGVRAGGSGAGHPRRCGGAARRPGPPAPAALGPASGG